MEDPKTWSKAERVINAALQECDRDRVQMMIGLSRAKRIATALREAGLLNE